ncbi:S-adenosyl-L-methionine-dependent methyltransferase [Ramaria rubella]|nr:S-adenosyl-L-methionine-dependent methyltransferase [Ramaria rubella]
MAPDPTFRSYIPQQAQQYAENRPAYPQVLYEHIFAEHARGGGRFEFVVDVGCGPGRATRDLAQAFEHAIGLDPGQEMLNVARGRGSKTKSGEDIRFEVCEAEHIADAPGVPVGKVDMITAATAAHWFDMKKFWPQAAKLLRPGGTVAFWTNGSYFAHPDMPYAVEVREIQRHFEDVLAPYMQPGNLIAHGLYDNLELPWTADPAQTAFPQDLFCRFNWDRDGVLSDGKDFFGGSHEFPLEYLEKAMGTASAVTRWREAHPNLVNTERDCVAELVKRLRAVLGDRGLRSGGSTALLMFRKRSE